MKEHYINQKAVASPFSQNMDKFAFYQCFLEVGVETDKTKVTQLKAFAETNHKRLHTSGRG
jgi:hypothetical protein